MKPQTAIVQMGGWGSVGMLRRYHGKLTTSELKRYPTTLAKYGGKDLRFLDQFGQIEPRQFYQPRLVGGLGQAPAAQARGAAQRMLPAFHQSPMMITFVVQGSKALLHFEVIELTGTGWVKNQS